LLVTGVETVVGANVAAQLADRFRVSGASSGADVSIEGCRCELLPAHDLSALRQVVAADRPDRIVICEAAGDSAWHPTGRSMADASALLRPRAWAQVAREENIALTLVSSDLVFSGPWMFHTETCRSYSDRLEARALRALETSVLEENPAALVVRTHAYGWSPLDDGLGWIEGIVATLESERAGLFDCAWHATPILASDLAETLAQGWQAGLSGLFHIAGAERSNSYRFASGLAEVFGLQRPRSGLLSLAAADDEGPRCETSLHTRKIRRALGVSMPLIVDGLERLRGQREDGFDRRFRGSRRLVPSKVA
jgi:dTDP-4-dehydrorhamnose reductase